MKLELKDFQVTAVDHLLGRLRAAVRDFEESGDKQALSLSAPTGAGKTVIAAAVLERLFEGDSDEPGGDPDAVVLWLTDQPSLNEQTRRKMIAASEVLTDQRVVTIDASFVDEELKPGRVYFLNIQKLAKNQPLVKPRDRRSRTIWDVLNSTASTRRGHFVLVIDEAHRGMSRQRSDDEGRTIVQRFILGHNSTLRPLPVVLGISATPERFNDLVETAPDRTTRRTNVDPEAVRASGLLKDAVLLRHPDEAQRGDTTLLRDSIRTWADITARWANYAEVQTIAPVEPILVIQVEDAHRRNTDSDTDLVAVLDTIHSAIPGLRPEALAHSFDLGGPISIGTRSVRYIKPEDAQEDPDVRIILFKTGLTTGWDCPRAEVMFSFRRAKEYVSVAQLIGRMVRTPLARKVSGDEVLNTVSLYLPDYNRETVQRVIERLQKNPDEAPPVDTISQPVICGRNTRLVSGVFDVMEAAPTYTVPGAGRTSQVSRLMKLATLLVGDGIDADALDKATNRLLDVVASERERLDRDGAFLHQVEAGGVLEVRVVRAEFAGDVTEGPIELISVDDRNLNDLFRQAAKRLKEGLATCYWRQRVQHDRLDPRLAKVEAYVLSRDGDTVRAVEEAASTLVVQWMNAHDGVIRTLVDASRQRYYEVQGQAKMPEISRITLPSERAYAGADTRWPMHVLSDSKGNVPLALGGWEVDVLTKELSDPALRAWYRNPTGGPGALRIPYRTADKHRPMYPDFLLVHEIGGELRPSIVDPHGHHLADAADKAIGLAEYADKHAAAFHRIDMVAKVDNVLRRIDLKNVEARRTIVAVTNQARLLSAFASFGTDFA